MRRKKTIVIVLIVLAVLIVTPVAVWSVWCWSAQRELDAKLDELHQRGEPVKFEELMPAAILPEENAAGIYQQAFERMEALPESTRLTMSIVGQDPWPPSWLSLAEARDLTASNAEILELLRRGAARLECLFADSYHLPPSFMPSDEHLTHAREGVGLLLLSAWVHQSDRRPDDALRDYLCAVRLARVLHEDPFPLATADEYRASRALLGCARSLLAKGPHQKEPLEALLEALEVLDDRERMVRATRWQRCYGLALARYQLNDAFRAENPVSWLIVMIPKTLMLKDTLAFLETMDERVELAGRPFLDVGAQLQENQDELLDIKPHRFSMVRLAGVLGATHTFLLYEESLARTRLLRVGILLKLHKLSCGSYPDELSELALGGSQELPRDPYSEGDFMYRKQGEGFLLCSSRERTADDEDTEQEPNTAEEDESTDIVWRCSR